jgi:hypothetical protein
MDLENLKKKPRADSVEAKSDGSIHDQWALHELAFAHETIPKRLRHYHEGRIMNGELMEGYFDEFIPEAYSADRGAVVKKKVERKTTYCPECNVPARKTDKGEPMCPECGLICNEKGPTHEIIRDGKAAGRTDGHQSQ